MPMSFAFSCVTDGRIAKKFIILLSNGTNGESMGGPSTTFDIITRSNPWRWDSLAPPELARLKQTRGGGERCSVLELAASFDVPIVPKDPTAHLGSCSHFVWPRCP